MRKHISFAIAATILGFCYGVLRHLTWTRVEAFQTPQYPLTDTCQSDILPLTQVWHHADAV